MTDASPAQTQAEKKPLKQRIGKWGAIIVVALILAFFLFRFIGSTSYTGTINRVYEKTSEYRVELEAPDGEVHVFKNAELRFPYLKFDTADLQAQLQSYQRNEDIVKVRAWGFRSTVFSWFPNVIDVDLVRKSREAKRQRAEQIVDMTLELMTTKKAISAEYAEGASRQALREELVEKTLDAMVGGQKN